jgi:hypothetical protein
MRTLLAWDEERNAMIELREGRSPFGIKGQGDHHRRGLKEKGREKMTREALSEKIPTRIRFSQEVLCRHQSMIRKCQPQDKGQIGMSTSGNVCYGSVCPAIGKNKPSKGKRGNERASWPA